MTILRSFLLIALLAGTVWAQSSKGVAYFSSNINTSQNPILYYSVGGGPPNTCGALDTVRNGEILYVPNWLCTDSNGNAMKGPWNWSDIPDNQTDKGVVILWPDGTKTNELDHIWAKSRPDIERSSPDGSPPTSLAGTATDMAWGAGFDAQWTKVGATFEDRTTGQMWNSVTGKYDDGGNVFVFADVTGMPSSGRPNMSIRWSFPRLPSPSAHTPGHKYIWTFGVSTPDYSNVFGTITFQY